MQLSHSSIQEVKNLQNYYTRYVLKDKLKFEIIDLNMPCSFKAVPNMCLNNRWSHMASRMKHFIVHILAAFQKLYSRSYKIKEDPTVKDVFPTMGAFIFIKGAFILHSIH